MADTIAFEIDGLEGIMKQFDLAPKESKAILRRSMAGLAADIRNNARRRAPERTRRLRKAIVSKRDRGTKTSIEASVVVRHGRGVKNGAFYWQFVEWGTRKLSGTPFLTPAFVRGREEFTKFFNNQFFKQLGKQLKKRGPSA